MSLYTGTIDCYPNCFCSPHEPFGILFWSSGAYFISSLLLYLQARKKSLEFEFWVFCTMTLAVSSFLFHSTLSHVNVALDYASIIMTLIFFPLWNQLTKLSSRKKETVFFVLFIFLWIIFLQLTKWMRIGLSFFIFLLVLRTIRKEAVRFRFHGYLQLSVILGLISFGFFLSEELRVACSLQGHTLWHLGSATALYFYGRWRFDFQN